MNLSKHKLFALLALALFTFVFLTAEFRFDIAMGTIAGPQSVVGAQGLILGASAIGFLTYGVLAQPRRTTVLVGSATVLSVLGIIAIEALTDAFMLQLMGCIAFFALGVLGAAAHTSFAMGFAGDPKLATGAGASYAAGILLQFVCNLVLLPGLAEGGALTLGTALLTACTVKVPCQNPDGSDCLGPVSPQPLTQTLWCVVLVAILACMFSTLDNVITLSNAHGTVVVQTWPRLFLAASGLFAGFVFDLADRRYMGLIMLGISALSTITILSVEAGADANSGLIVFYLSSGFFATFFTSLFTQLAPTMNRPALWSGMGRAVNNICAFTVSGAAFVLVSSGNVALIMIFALVLLVCASAAFFAAGLMRLPQSAREREHQRQAEEALASPSKEERQRALIRDCALTPREVDVLIAVTADERPLKQVAGDLGISLRMVQRHLSSIYQKTGTQTRAGLTKRYME